MNTYEAMFIFPNKYSEEKLKSALDRVNKEIVTHGGEVKGTIVIGSRKFARPMHKKTAGQYVKVLFDIEPNQIAVLTGRYKLNDDVFRVQMVVADNVIIGNYKTKPEEKVEEKSADVKKSAK